MKLRILTSLLLIPPVIYFIGWAPKWLLLAVVIVAAELCFYEFLNICQLAGFKTFSVLAYAANAALCLAQAANTSRPELYMLALLVTFVLITLTVALALTRDLRTYLSAIATTVFGVMYIGLALSCLLPLRFSELGARSLGLMDTPGFLVGRKLMLLLFLVIWADDTFAYLVGRTIGRRILFPTISPRKTLEGSVGGFAGSLLAAWVFASLWWKTANLERVMLLAALVSVFGQIGDLAESALKRSANTKDSGSLLPGHGGLLDRMDSLLFGVPVLWLALTIMDFWR